MSTLALAIQTIPDIETGRRLHNIDNLSDLGVAKAMFHLQQQHTGSEELPLYLQKIVSIALAYERDGKVYTETTSIDCMDIQTEQMLLQYYVDLVRDQRQITWQGNTHDFPILRYRALKQGVKLSAWNNSAMQIDLSQQFSSEVSASVANLAEISCLLDLPLLPQLSKTDIWQAYLAEDYKSIDAAAEASAKNIYRIYQAML